tara:strand:- start:60 stop:443 length:384 start_codon:yes stop_codon:yes gene_type:complete
MNIDTYLATNKTELLSLFSQIYTGRITETLINPSKYTEEEFTKSCCLDAVVSYRRSGKNLDFPIKRPNKITEIDKRLSQELYIITLYEEEVRLGSLKRSGFRYCTVGGYNIPNVPKKKKYLIPPTEM